MNDFDQTMVVGKMISDHALLSRQNYVCLDESSFATQAGDDFPAKYGWTLPSIGLFCPGRIVRHTNGMTVKERILYVQAILWMCDRHVVWEREIPNPVDRQMKIESELLEAAPGSLAIVSKVELRVLDNDR